MCIIARCWINPHALPYEDTFEGIPRAKHPHILRTNAQPTPIARDDHAPPTQYSQSHAPQYQRLTEQRQHLADRLAALRDNGLPIHVTQAFWRTLTAGDLTFTARPTGITPDVAPYPDNCQLSTTDPGDDPTRLDVDCSP